MPTTCETTSTARQFHPCESMSGIGFTVETLVIGNAEFDVYSREERRHSNLAINGITRAKAWEFTTGTVHLDVHDNSGAAHTIALRSADDVEAMIALLTNALSNREVLS